MTDISLYWVLNYFYKISFPRQTYFHCYLMAVMFTASGNLENADLENRDLELKQGLEGYSRDPGFDQNTVRDSGKRKIS